MVISTALSALKTAGDLLKSTRDAAKAGSLRPDEFAGRVAEAYDYIIDSKQGLLDAQEAIAKLNEEIQRLKSSVFHHSVSWMKRDGVEDGPFCPICNGDGIIMRLLPDRSQAPGTYLFYCPKKHSDPGRGKREPLYPVPKELIPKGRYSAETLAGTL